MKYNINKMQNGGGIPAFTMLLPILVNNASSKRYDYGMDWDSSSSSSGSRSSKKTSDSDDNSKGEITDKDIFSYLKDLNGLESDISGIFKELRHFYALKDYGALNTENLALRAVSIMHKIKIADQNAKEFENAYNQSKSKNSFSEFAVTGHDQVYVLSENGIELIDVDDYLEDKDLYKPLTNSELLSLRAHNLPFNNNILRVVNESTSMSEIGNLIKGFLVNLGKESESTSWYEKNMADRIQKGIEAILNGAKNGVDIAKDGIDGLYKVEQLTEDLIDAAKFAIRYIEEMLPNSANTLLKLHLNGNLNKIHGAIADFIYSQTSTNKKYDKTLIKDPDDYKSSSSNSSSSSTGSDDAFKTMNNDLFENIVRGIGGERGKFTIQNKDGATIVLEGVGYPNLNVLPSNPWESLTLSSMLSDLNFGSIVSLNYPITFGEAEVTELMDPKSIVTLNDTKSTRVWLPTKINDKKHIVPNLSILEDPKNKEIIDQINLKIIKGEDWSQDKLLIQKIKDSTLKDILFSEFSGTINTNSLHPYLLINGITSDGSFSASKESLSEKIDSNSQLYKQYIELFKAATKLDFDLYSGWNIFDWGESNHNHIYKGTVCIPLNSNITEAKRGANTTIKENDALVLERLYLISQHRQSLNSSSPDLLN